VWLPNQVWASDITYIRLQNTPDAEFCVRALEEAITRVALGGLGFGEVPGQAEAYADAGVDPAL